MSGRILPAIGSSEPWVTGARIGHATCLLAPNPSPWTLDGTNTWVVADGGQCIVVDPGPDDPMHLRAIADHADAWDLRIAMIVLTHGHVDHSAGAAALAAASGARVRAVDPRHRLGAEGLEPGSAVQVGSLDVRVIATPGHSSDSVSLLVDADRTMLTGDTVLGRGTSVVAHPDGELAAYLHSLHMLRDTAFRHDVRRLLPGHGPALDDPAGVLDAYLAHRRARLDEVRAALGAGARTDDDVVSVVYADVPGEVRPAALLTVRAQLDYLRARGELRD